MANIQAIRNMRGQTFYFTANTVNGHTVQKDVPANAVFTDTTYQLFTTELNPDKGGLVSVPSSSIPSAEKNNYFLAADGTWVDATRKISSDLEWVKDANESLESTKIGDVANNQATAQYSIACGQNTVADKSNQLVIGKYNQSNSNVNDVFTVGNGTSGNRKTIFNVTKEGDIYLNLESTELLHTIINQLGWQNDVQINIYQS